MTAKEFEKAINDFPPEIREDIKKKHQEFVGQAQRHLGPFYGDDKTELDEATHATAERLAVSTAKILMRAIVENLLDTPSKRNAQVICEITDLIMTAEHLLRHVTGKNEIVLPTLTELSKQFDFKVHEDIPVPTTPPESVN